MEIHRFVSDLLSSNMYLITEGKAALVIDPFRDTSPADGLQIERILLTHEHYDHISGVNAWKEKTGAPVLCSRPCGENIRSPRKNLSRIFEPFCELQTWIRLERLPDFDPNYSCEADKVFTDEMSFDWRGHRLRLSELPGHSEGSIGITLDEMYFFSGDSLLENSLTELRFPGGSRKQWEMVSLPKLETLPDGMKIFPGHFEPFQYKKTM